MNQKVLILNLILVLSLVISVRGGTLGGNCPIGCQYSRAASQCQQIFGGVTIDGCENNYDDYCDCVAKKQQWCLGGWCPLEKKHDADCRNWLFWC